MHQEGKVLPVLAAPQTQQVAILDVAPYRGRVPSHTYRPRVSTPQVSPDSVQRPYCCEVGIQPGKGISSRSSAGAPRNPRSLARIWRISLQRLAKQPLGLGSSTPGLDSPIRLSERLGAVRNYQRGSLNTRSPNPLAF